MINPVVFRRLLPSWKAAELLPFLNHRYKELEKLFNQKFFHPLNITKVIESKQELEIWEKRLAAEDIRDFLKQSIDKENPESIRAGNAEGFGEVLQSAYIDTSVFLNAAAAHLSEKGRLIEASFSHDEIQLTPEGLIYQGKNYDTLIFCEGFFVHRNPYFSFLPFAPVKGDVLTVSIEGYKYDKILNKNFFLLPQVNGTYRLGATYDWQNLNFAPDQVAKDDLLKRASQYVKGEIKVLKHEAGVRPASNDRRPFIGPHPQHPQLYIFNGLGTKGIMLAPFFAAQLASHLIAGTPIEKEASVERCYHLKK